jgi:uncharacterized membrane protein
MDHGRDNEFWHEGARHDGWWGGPLHLLFFLLVVALLIVGVVWIVRRLSPAVAPATIVPAVGPAAAISADPAVAALRMRYARGEVSREDFRDGMQDLTGAAAPWPGSDPGGDVASTES